jgi:DNA sulfur modification protein DndE
MAQASLDGAISMLGLKGWGPDPDAVPLGDYGRRYFIRAVVAQVGFGANKNEYATYQNTMRDANRMRLNGQNTYTFTMNADDLPPVDAFWSMTVYQDNGFLAVNEMAAGLGIERYAVGTNTGLVEDDGKVTVTLSHLPPQGIPLSNWLPVPAGDFQLTLRFYDPRDEILKNEWEIPELIRE